MEMIFFITLAYLTFVLLMTLILRKTSNKKIKSITLFFESVLPKIPFAKNKK